MRAKWFIAALACMLVLSGSVFSQIKIGVFDSQRVSEETEEGKKYQSELDRSRAAKASEIDAKQKEIKELEDQLAAQRQSLSEDKIAAIEKDIQKKIVELKRLQEDATKDFQNELLEAQKNFQDELIAAVEEVGREGGYALILERIQCIYYSGVVDITNQVIEKLNQNYLKRSQQSTEK